MLYVFCRYSLIANLIYLLAIAQDSTGLKVRPSSTPAFCDAQVWVLDSSYQAVISAYTPPLTIAFIDQLQHGIYGFGRSQYPRACWNHG